MHGITRGPKASKLGPTPTATNRDTPWSGPISTSADPPQNHPATPFETVRFCHFSHHSSIHCAPAGHRGTSDGHKLGHNFQPTWADANPPRRRSRHKRAGHSHCSRFVPPAARVLKSLGMRVPGGSNPSPSAVQKGFGPGATVRPSLLDHSLTILVPGKAYRQARERDDP
jgi:hypothetical protein